LQPGTKPVFKFKSYVLRYYEVETSLPFFQILPLDTYTRMPQSRSESLCRFSNVCSKNNSNNSSQKFKSNAVWKAAYSYDWYSHECPARSQELK